MRRMRRRGWTVRHVPQSRVEHLEGAATGISDAAGDRPLPDYWYQSRRRYFALTGGRRALVAANAFAVAGLAISLVKRAMGRRSPGMRPRARRLMGRTFGKGGGAVRPAVAAWGDPPGTPPAWMGRQ